MDADKAGNANILTEATSAKTRRFPAFVYRQDFFV
jgi:hypothetical protein